MFEKISGAKMITECLLVRYTDTPYIWIWKLYQYVPYNLKRIQFSFPTVCMYFFWDLFLYESFSSIQHSLTVLLWGESSFCYKKKVAHFLCICGKKSM